jgi:hypothetical protein
MGLIMGYEYGMHTMEELDNNIWHIHGIIGYSFIHS